MMRIRKHWGGLPVFCFFVYFQEFLKQRPQDHAHKEAVITDWHFLEKRKQSFETKASDLADSQIRTNLKQRPQDHAHKDDAHKKTLRRSSSIHPNLHQLEANYVSFFFCKINILGSSWCRILQVFPTLMKKTCLLGDAIVYPKVLEQI